MRRFFHLVAATLLASGVALGTSTAIADIVIDDFSSTTGLVFPGTTIGPTPPATTTVTEAGPLSGVLGSSRETELNLTGGTAGASSLNVNISGGLMNIALGPNSSAGNVEITYDAGGAGLGADFSSELGIDVIIASLDAAAAAGAGTDFTVTITDNDTSHTQSIQTTTTGAQTLFFDFSLFSDLGNLDLSSIFSISLLVTPNDEGDLSIDLIRTRGGIIPEPASLAVWSLMGLVGYGLRRRSKVARS